MSVGTGNIKLSDVTTEIYGDTNAGRSLVGCFADAVGTFHPSYVGDKDRLSNFKGYDNKVYDLDGNSYGIIKIGDTIWMSENLKTSKYVNKASIPGEGRTVAWRAKTTGAWCHYNNSGETGYGKLYNGYAVNTG